MEEQLWDAVRTLEPLAPEFVSVTYGAGGTTRERTHATVARIQRETSLAAAAHLPLGLADKLWLETTRPELFPIESYFLGSNRSARTAAYHVRPFGRPVIECFYGGALARDLERDGEAAALDFARRELAAHLGADAAVAVRPLRMTAWGGEPSIHGAYAYQVPGGAGSRARLAQPVDGRLFFAGEACSPHRFTTAHGAYETGLAAAEGALAAITRRDRPSARA